MIITFDNPKGGSSKSTLLYNLAIRLSKERAVSVVDMDIQGSIAEYLSDRGGVAPFDYVSVHSKRPKDMGPRVEAVASSSEVTLIDTPARYTEETFVALALADLAIVPMRPSRGDYTALRQIISRLPLPENESLRFEVVLNSSRNHRNLRAPEIYANLIEEETPLHFSGLSIGARVYWERTALGFAVCEQDPVSPEAIEELEGLYNLVSPWLMK